MPSLTPSSSPSTSELLSTLRLLQRRKKLILAVTASCLSLAAVTTVTATPQYTAQADVLVVEPGRNAIFAPTPGYVRTDPQYLTTQIELLVSDVAADQLREAGTDLDALTDIDAAQVGSTSIIRITATSPDPQAAATIAEGFATSYLSQQSAQAELALTNARREIDSKIADLTGKIAALDAEADRAVAGDTDSRLETVRTERDGLVVQLATFRQRADQLEVDTAATSDAGRITSHATVPSAPSSPKPLLNVLLGLFGGLLLGAGAAMLAHRLDTKVPAELDRFRELVDVPVLGGVPAHPAKDGVAGLIDPSGAASESFRMLWTSLQFAGMDRALRTVAVTSPMPSDGKTTTSANLAVAFARTGQSVVLVDCDLRRPQVAASFGLGAGPGLTGVLLGSVSVQQAVRSVPGHEDLPLVVLTAGMLPPNPAELLSSARATEVLAELTKQFDVVVLDTPPLLPVAESVVVATRADHVVVVTSAGTSRVAHLHAALDRLRAAGCAMSGVVLNREKRSRETDRAYRAYEPLTGA